MFIKSSNQEVEIVEIWQNLEKKRITDHNPPPIYKMWGRKITRRLLRKGIFSAKNVAHQHGFEPTTSCLPGRRSTNCAKVTNLGTN